MKRAFFWLVLIFLLYGFAEVSSLGSLYALKKVRSVVYAPMLTDRVLPHQQEMIRRLIAKEPKYFNYSFALGWTVMKNGSSDFYQSNSMGIRANREYDLYPPENVLRIAAFGDSFTHSNGVKNSDAWEVKLEAMTQNLEVLNFGVSAYGLDQAYLRYIREGRKSSPHIVIIGFMSDDIYRHVNVYRPFFSRFTAMPLTKPRFIIENAEMTLLENPMKTREDYQGLLDDPETVMSELGAKDYYFNAPFAYKTGPADFLPSVRLSKILLGKMAKENDPERILDNGDYNTHSQAYQITLKLFDAFCDQVKKNGALPIIMIFPQQIDVGRFKKSGTKKYQALLDHFQSRGDLYFDVLDGFAKQSPQLKITELFDGHYSAFGYELVARQTMKFMESHGLTSPRTVREFLTKTSVSPDSGVSEGQ